MKWSTITTISLLAGSALGAPVTSTTAELNISDELRNQGDGFYTASLNEDGNFDVNFTPMAEIVARDASPVPEIPVITHPTPPGNEIHCGPGSSNNVPDLDSANEQLARNAPGGLSTGPYGWVHLNDQTSFWCNYQQNILKYDLVIGMHIALSKKCGGSAVYGYTHYTEQNGAKNLAVGRTFTGDHFCTKNFKGKREPAPEPVPAPKTFTVAEHLMNQGNGLYIAKFNEAGEASVDFTPASEMPSVDITTANLAAKNAGPLHKRDGVECVEGTSKNLDDLNLANVVVANTVQGVFYDPGTFIWYIQNKETSYACAYRAWHGSHDTVIQYHVDLSGACTNHESDYGYKHHAARSEKDINLSVGRTYTGNKFCNKHFHPAHRQVEERPPAPKALTVAKNLMQQGNGFYVATFNEAGEASVEFTPAAQLPAIDIPLTTENPAVKSIRTLQKRGEVHCDGRSSNSLADLTWANVQLANNARGQKYHNKWGWVHNNAETSYFCAYRTWSGSYDTIMGFHKAVNNRCKGEHAYGFARHVGAVWDSDYQLAVGRTYYGDNFCDGSSHGKSDERRAALTEPVETPTELSHRDTMDCVDKPTELSLRDVDPMDQGDGLHEAWVDENGILQVAFTPISELMAGGDRLFDSHAVRNTVGADATKTTCLREHKFSNKVEDLDYANVLFAKIMERQGGRMKPEMSYWVLNGQETSYACTGTNAQLTYDNFINLHISISNACGGSSAYGYTRFRPSWLLDFTVGRTWRGGSICNKWTKPTKAQVAKTSAPPRRSTSSDLNIASDLMFQGDGFYTATVDDSGTVDVEFTPMAQLPPTAELLSKARAEGLLDHTSDSTDALHKRTTECGGRDSGSLSDLNGANIQLAHNGDGKTYSPKAWGWVHNNGETSYFCPYTRFKVSYKEVIEMHTIISRKCGVAAYGWDHRYVVQGRDFSVGRTFYGNHFCNDHFTGIRPPRAVGAPSSDSAPVDSAPADSAPVKATSLAADAAKWDMTSGQMDQGDGLYVASLDDETGQMSVKFTPIAKLSSRATLTDASRWDMTSTQMDQGDGLYVASLDDETGQMNVKFTPMAELSNSVSRAPVSMSSPADSTSDLTKRDGDKTTCRGGSSKYVADLDDANRELAEAGSRINLKNSPVGWVHKNGETSYWCAPKGPSYWREPYGYFINQQTIVSNTCGGTAAYGWNSFEGNTVSPPSTADSQADRTEISVGRTFRGGSICWKDYVPPAVASTPESSNILSKRDSVKQTCRGGLSKNVPDLDYANSVVAKYGNQLNLKKSPITWLHNNGETSYWCFMEGADGWTRDYDYFINEQIKVSSHCPGGSAAYGWSHSRGYEKFNGWHVWTELSVGRTFKGGPICRKNFIPPPAAASIEASPVEVAPRSAPFDARNQGEGFYLETFNDAGESIIKFTPRAEFEPYVPSQSSVSENLAAESINALHKRSHKSTCAKYVPKKSGSWQDVDEANVQLGRQCNGVHFDARTRGWVNINKELAYMCAYSAWDGTYDQVIEANVLTSSKCGGSTGYGYDYENKKDLSIGRTWFGDHFCKSNTRRDEAAQDQSVSADAIGPMGVRSDLLHQGDGFYFGTTNEAGEQTVNFTPIAELAHILPAQLIANKTGTATTTVTTPKNAKYLKYWCRGYSKNTPDLDFANVALASLWDSRYLGWHVWGYFVKGDDLSYICGYSGGTHSHADIIDAQVRVSQHCKGGSQRYGWEAIDGLSVGRTFNGDGFCV